MAWTCVECDTQYIFDPPSKWQPDADEEDAPVCADCRE